MSYDIEAWLAADGSPRLQLIDADSGSVRLVWGDCPKAESDSNQALKGLFRELMLLSALQRLEQRH
ncbi:MAG: hypothetical protein RJQ08_07670 [Salinisphaeraceae bacterium]|uniref:Uncharacterized protein n=2 Tax=Spectribacter TaxID=3160928 RepID=A0ABU3BW97_9GAMM|nr:MULTISPECIES: hypothetical protein [unclassified Salinisphaera]MDT0618845.1 hypothetical protein [Salinisphaera sp. P385]MDT0633550.1 hypothetical protein [Salinisphaera sp. W335]